MGSGVASAAAGGGCGSATFARVSSQYYIKWKRPIKFVIFRVCVNDAGPDTCRTAY